MKVFWQLEAPQRRSLLILFAAGLFFWSSMGSLLPTLPAYVSDVGGTPQQVGIVMGSFAIWDGARGHPLQRSLTGEELRPKY